MGRDAAGRRIGRIWLDPVPSPGPFLDTRWLFQIVVDSPLRGHGFGRALLRAAEEHVVESGHAELALNVFRWNTAAVALYTGSECGIAFQADQALELRRRIDDTEGGGFDLNNAAFGHVQCALQLRAAGDTTSCQVECETALKLLDRARASADRQRLAWLAAGAAVARP